MTTTPLAIRALTPGDARVLSDGALIAEQRRLASAQRVVEASAAVIAAEIGRRSHPNAGYSGLAQSLGQHRPEKLVQQLTGLSGPEARRLLRVGALVTEPSPWMAPVSAAVSAGELSIGAADVIRAGLGEAGRVAADDLLDASNRLVGDAQGLTLEQLAAKARDARATLDLEGVPAREEELRDRRFLAFTALPNGNVGIRGEADPESAAILQGAVDAITSPRRGGPRFVDASAAPTVAVDDARSIPQLMLDALVEITKLATLADTGAVLGKRRVGVRVHVAERDLRTSTGTGAGTGFAHIEGQSAVVSIATAERIACDAGMIPLVFDAEGQVVHLGRQQRLHSARMRLGIAARDGGCVMNGCDRPPQWCEVHHINQWLRDDGETSVEDGVLLCRHHHMLIHNNGWRITRAGARYSSVSPNGDVTELRPKNPILTRLRT